jgi:putative FmdB family regulatory protein
MPIREYKCTKCEKVTEKLLLGSQAAPKDVIICDCGGEADLIISAPSPPKLVKGSGGFYKPSYE